MLLVMNTIVDKPAAGRFDENVSHLYDKDEYNTIYLADLSGFNDYEQCTHLLVSGSELSASKGSEYDKDIITIINVFIEQNKSIYGICYGHQMIARAILGDKGCRRADVSEFGWHGITLEEDELFAGIINPVFAQSHYDEVCNLSDDFTILASSEVCEVLAFRYKDMRVWGTQFHPEVTYKNGEGMRVDNLKSEEAAKDLSKNELESPEHINQNYKLFRNFYPKK